MPLGSREHNSSLDLERAVRLFTCESRCGFVDNSTFLQLKLFFFFVFFELLGEVGYLEDLTIQTLTSRVPAMSPGATRGC